MYLYRLYTPRAAVWWQFPGRVSPSIKGESSVEFITWCTMGASWPNDNVMVVIWSWSYIIGFITSHNSMSSFSCAEKCIDNWRFKLSTCLEYQPNTQKINILGFTPALGKCEHARMIVHLVIRQNGKCTLNAHEDVLTCDYSRWQNNDLLLSASRLLNDAGS